MAINLAVYQHAVEEMWRGSLTLTVQMGPGEAEMYSGSNVEAECRGGGGQAAIQCALWEVCIHKWKIKWRISVGSSNRRWSKWLCIITVGELWWLMIMKRRQKLRKNQARRWKLYGEERKCESRERRRKKTMRRNVGRRVLGKACRRSSLIYLRKKCQWLFKYDAKSIKTWKPLCGEKLLLLHLPLKKSHCSKMKEKRRKWRRRKQRRKYGGKQELSEKYLKESHVNQSEGDNLNQEMKENQYNQKMKWRIFPIEMEKCHAFRE